MKMSFERKLSFWLKKIFVIAKMLPRLWKSLFFKNLQLVWLKLIYEFVNIFVNWLILF